MLKGIVITFMTLAVTLIISLMYHFSFSLSLPSFKAETITRLTVQIIFTWWGYSFEGFRTAYDGSIWWVYWLMSYFILPLTSFLGYLAGTKEYELSHKFFSWLVYKKDNKD